MGFVTLLLELAFIRWLPAYIPFLTFFPNFVLLAVFVGMSVGCMVAGRPRDWLSVSAWVFVVACVAAIACHVAVVEYGEFRLRIGDPQSPARVYFGTIVDAGPKSRPVVPVEAAVAGCFALVALSFLGLGQALGRALDAAPNRVRAYTFNIAGSIAGIIAMAAASHAQLAPLWWFGPGLAGWAWLARGSKRSWLQVLPLVAGLALIGYAGARPTVCRAAGEPVETRWSPYYWVKHFPDRRHIMVNNIGHQTMASTRTFGAAYSLPYWLLRDSGHEPVRDVLIIGAGSGNDAAHALQQPVRRVDAVEIDPAIAAIGRQHHPDQPYSDARVQLHIDDGRRFLARTTRRYDLIVYALVDSLTLQSSYSSLRLESYLFTVEAFRAARQCLKPNGVLVVYNYFREGWLVARLRNTIAAAFGEEPLVACLPPATVLRDTDPSPHMTVLLAGHIPRVREAFRRSGAFLLNPVDPDVNRRRNGFDAAAATGNHPDAVRPTTIATTRQWAPATDDRPFFYMKDRRIPTHNLWGLAIVLAISLGLLAAFSPRHRVGFNPHFMFLGAGFMLIETQGVIRMGLVFGSTWSVNSAVFLAVLVVILLSNFYVERRRPAKLAGHYAALCVCLALSLWVGLDRVLQLPALVRPAAACALLFAPVFFAGVIFATSFGRSRTGHAHFGANIAGAVLGGVLEYASLVVGYPPMVIVAGALYLLSWAALRWPGISR